MPIKPKEMPTERWNQLNERAGRYATKGETTGTLGGYTKARRQALLFFVARWEGKNVGAPSWMKPLLPKKYPKEKVGKIKSFI